MDKKNEVVAKFEALPEQYRMFLSAAMEMMNNLGMVTNGFRNAEGDERKVALEALNLLHESAPTRHKKEISAAMKNAVERFWAEKDSGMLPKDGETPVAH